MSALLCLKLPSLKLGVPADTKIIEFSPEEPKPEETNVKEIALSAGPCLDSMPLPELRVYVGQLRPDKAGSLAKASRKVLLGLLKDKSVTTL
jgi:hypothetical protein